MEMEESKQVLVRLGLHMTHICSAAFNWQELVTYSPGQTWMLRGWEHCGLLVAALCYGRGIALFISYSD